MVRPHQPPTDLEDPDAVAMAFLEAIGYLPKGYAPRTGASDVKDSVPYRLFVDCFLRRPDRAWTVPELRTVLGTSEPTVYRHLNKLRGLHLVEVSDYRPDDRGQTKHRYRLMYRDLSKAWNLVEAQVEQAMASYRKTVDHLQTLLQEAEKVRR